MTNEDLLQDLKQFITATVSQQLKQELAESEQRITENLGGRIDKLEVKVDKLESKVDKLEQKIDDVDQKADAILEAVGERFNEQDKRLTKLEQAPA